MPPPLGDNRADNAGVNHSAGNAGNKETTALAVPVTRRPQRFRFLTILLQKTGCNKVAGFFVPANVMSGSANVLFAAGNVMSGSGNALFAATVAAPSLSPAVLVFHKKPLRN